MQCQSLTSTASHRMCARHSDIMSLHENKKSNGLMDEPQRPESAHRLYPSLPHTDRFDRGATEEQSPKAQRPQTNKQLCVADGDVRLKAQIHVLVEQRRELISINDRWAKEYQTMVRYYREKIRDLKASLQQNPFDSGASEDGQKNATTCKKAKLKILCDKDDKQGFSDEHVYSELLMADKEAQELRAQNSVLTRRGQHQQEEIKRLNKALEGATHTNNESLQDLWKHQAEVYQEDFRTERKDREKLKEKYLDLENRFRRVRTELHVLKSHANCTPPPQPRLERVGSNRVIMTDTPINHRQQPQLS